ncbi:DNA topoisomerase 2-binding protein 1 [Dermatophagoides farinae]|uniref:DNA topoisomerase 2-binding protein 1 n=1 Tax=Dermatophagoides farinae TaxID=6954 RepID=A0A922L2M7_DERFA|nr:DNA topoisomerase 2-binding protein 1 [Dermatophagoides farinae]
MKILIPIPVSLFPILCLQKKARIAAINRISIVTTEWIESCWAKYQHEYRLANEESIISKYRLPILHGLNIVFSGLNERDKISNIIESNGGECHSDLITKPIFKNTILLVAEKRGEHYENAQRFNIYQPGTGASRLPRLALRGCLSLTVNKLAFGCAAPLLGTQPKEGTAAPPPAWHPAKGVNFNASCLTVDFYARRFASGFRFGTAGSAMTCVLYLTPLKILRKSNINLSIKQHILTPTCSFLFV